MAQALAIRFTVFRWTIWFKLWTRLVIYPMSGNNAMLKIDFTDPRKRSFVRSFLYTGSEMMHLPWINVRRINLNEKFSRSSRPVFLKFLRNSQEITSVGFSFLTLLKRDFGAGVFQWICEIFKNTFSMEHPMWLLLVWQVYLHQIINLNTNVLKVFQVSLELFLG